MDFLKKILPYCLLLIARHYIYTCRLRKALPKLQVYIQLIMNSMKIEKQIALDNNKLYNSFQGEMGHILPTTLTFY